MSTEPDRAPRIRDKERTRLAVLRAAETVFAAQGTGVALAEVAREAGVSKSGLLHHFPSRDALNRAVVEHVVERIWDEVLAHVDPADERPGAFARGYLRALTGDSDYLTEMYSASGLLAQLGTARGLDLSDMLGSEDAERIDAAFAADGLPPGRGLVVRYAAEGVALSLNTPYLTEAQRLAVRADLFALTEAP